MILTDDLILQFQESELDACGYLGLMTANKLLRDEMCKWPFAYGRDDLGGAFHVCDPKIGLSDSSCTHKARMMPPQPIKQETAEDVLRDLIKWYEDIPFRGETMNSEVRNEIVERARKVIKNG